MGYTLEMRAGSVDDVVAELRSPTVTAADLAGRVGGTDLLDEVIDRWSEYAQAAAQAAASGGGALDAGMAAYLVAVVQVRTHWYGALGHSSSGGEDFRAFLAGPASDVLGRDLVRHLLNRELAGMSSPVYPWVGWVSNAELRAAVARGLPDVPEGLGPDDEEALSRLVAAVARAASGGLDLLGVYA
ncbi:hypothetical protein Cfla_2523 [Cellulomonas flavigena DSM 20109]|uniref:Uncharacterized protein n=1 Tax=Cellulomonas flavigena (strain ATCC 482 / DSM 20109 / BCRC 11376 / JCM 18109 / NBRC 3775 / NCIMB 8073 / NRS 134) TaxID=446466 RepID=D5UI66_CELFN|nr:hypothetical protein Cfla_2523 [Cellulomonas flavigena DSM 20109]